MNEKKENGKELEN